MFFRHLVHLRALEFTGIVNNACQSQKRLKLRITYKDLLSTNNHQILFYLVENITHPSHALIDQIPNSNEVTALSASPPSPYIHFLLAFLLFISAKGRSKQGILNGLNEKHNFHSS